MNINTKLKYKWNFWYHHEKDNWKLSGYKKFYEIVTIKDFWKIYNNFDKLGGITSKHFFLMRENITPIWEDEQNINGGCWSFKIHEDNAKDLWEYLSLHLLCGSLCNISEEILGLSICLKKNNNTVIKIWNKNSKNNSLKLINESILKKWGTDIIYIAHMPDN